MKKSKLAGFSHSGSSLTFLTRLLLHPFTQVPFFLFLLFVSPASAADLSVFSGYDKVLASFSQTRDTEEGFFGVLNRLRLEYQPKLTDAVELNLTYDHQVFANDFARAPDFDLIRQNNQGNLAFLDLDHAICDTDHVYETHGLYRAYLRVTTPHSRTTIGKQLIDWGRMRTYSPLDIFNQPLPTSLEPDERAGFDAILAELFQDAFAGMNVLYGPGDNASGSSYGMRFYKKFGTYDTSLVLANHREELVAGFGFDGYVKGAGLRGEFAYSKNGRDTFPRAAIGIDYNFPKQIYLALEYFYNGAANGDLDTFINSLREQQYRMSLQKNLVGLIAATDITPVWKLKGLFIYDINQGSAAFNPEVRYSIKQNIDAACGAHLFVDSRDSEFENSRNLYYGEIKWYF